MAGAATPGFACGGRLSRSPAARSRAASVPESSPKYRRRTSRPDRSESAISCAVELGPSPCGVSLMSSLRPGYLTVIVSSAPPGGATGRTGSHDLHETFDFPATTMASSSSGERDGQMEPIGVDEYFKKPEGLRPMELVYGFVREPPAPQYGHQSVVTRLSSLLDAHVRALGLGQVCVSPVDVVLDAAAALVLQPDIVFIAGERLHIVQDR